MVARLETKYEIVMAIAIFITIIFIWTSLFYSDCIKAVWVALLFAIAWLNWPTNTSYQNFWNKGLSCTLTANATPAVTNPRIDPLA